MEFSPTLGTARTDLRRPTPDDLDALVPLAADWDVARMLSTLPHPYGPAEGLRFLTEIVPNTWEGGGAVWAVTLGGAFVGTVGLHPKVRAGTLEFGYWYGRSVWGRGLATEVGRVVLAHAFAVRPALEIVAGAFVDNPASARVLTKLGYDLGPPVLRGCVARGVRVPCTEAVLTAAGFARAETGAEVAA